MKLLTLFLLTVLTLNVAKTEKKTVFIGTIETNEQSKKIVQGLTIEFRIDSLVIAKNLVRENSCFSISATSDKEIDIYFSGQGIHETYLQTIHPTELDTLMLSFKLPKNYEMKGDKAICQKCHESDQTIPIAYGFKTIIVYSKGQPSYTTYEGYGKSEVFDGGCSTTCISAKYYCKRDKIKF